MSRARGTCHILVALTTCVATQARAQVANSPLTVAEAIKRAPQLGATTVSVHGHFWCGKEGSMIYDSYYKSILRVRYSEDFMKRHRSFRSACGFDEDHKSNMVTMTGNIEPDKDGKLDLLIKQIIFDK